MTGQLVDQPAELVARRLVPGEHETRDEARDVVDGVGLVVRRRLLVARLHDPRHEIVLRIAPPSFHQLAGIGEQLTQGRVHLRDARGEGHQVEPEADHVGPLAEALPIRGRNADQLAQPERGIGIGEGRHEVARARRGEPVDEPVRRLGEERPQPLDAARSEGAEHDRPPALVVRPIVVERRDAHPVVERPRRHAPQLERARHVRMEPLVAQHRTEIGVGEYHRTPHLRPRDPVLPPRVPQRPMRIPHEPLERHPPKVRRTTHVRHSHPLRPPSHPGQGLGGRRTIEGIGARGRVPHVRGGRVVPPRSRQGARPTPPMAP